MRQLLLLGRDLALGVACALALVIGLQLAGLVLDPILPMAIGLAAGAGAWFLRGGLPRADASVAPALDTDPEDGRPDARDLQVRRLEAAAEAAQPSRRITPRALGQALGEIAEERRHDEDAAPVPDQLRRLIQEAGQTDADAHPVRPIDRRTLHSYLRALAATRPDGADAAGPTQEDRP